MATVSWACWDGGGNLNPSLGIARALEERGHSVHFHGRPEMVERVEAAGLSATVLDHSRTDLDRFSFHPLPSVFGYTSSPTVGEELVDVMHRTRPDVVVIDAMFGAALEVAPRFGCPTMVMVHTFMDRIMDGWRANLGMQSNMRLQAGFDAIGDLDELWGTRDLVHVNTLGSFDGEPSTSWSNVVHGAPVLTAEQRAQPVELPWELDDPTPIVLLSFSTVPEQRSPDTLQRALDALGRLPVHVVATTCGTVSPADLKRPDNAHVVEFADHDALLPRASLVVGHGGHGTTMRTLRSGVPLVGIPAKGADQVPITCLMEKWRVGRALPGDADADLIEQAAAAVLADPTYRAEALRRSRAFVGMDGAALAADSVESLMATPAGVGSDNEAAS
jgi:UDP:flavonoid glycosyltransferase YjiC (YdhE family)